MSMPENLEPRTEHEMVWTQTVIATYIENHNLQTTTDV